MNEEDPLGGPALSLDLNAETQSLRTSASWQQGKQSARTLLMQPDLQVVLIAMPSGSRLERQKATQRILVQVLEGHVTLDLPLRSLSLVAGNLLALDKSIVHEVLALQDSTILLSLSGAPEHQQTHLNTLESLSQEHRRFAKLLDLMEEQIHQFGHGQQPDYDLLRDILDYMTDYADHFHHPPEDVMFDRLVERVPSTHRHVQSLTEQHRSIAQHGTRFLSNLRSALDEVILPREAVESPAHEYIKLYREHIRIEEQYVFPLCREHLRWEDWDSVRTAFEAQADPLLHNPTGEKYRALRRQMLELLAPGPQG